MYRTVYRKGQGKARNIPEKHDTDLNKIGISATALRIIDIDQLCDKQDIKSMFCMFVYSYNNKDGIFQRCNRL